MDERKVRDVVLEALKMSLELQLEAVGRLRRLESDMPELPRRRRGRRRQSLVDQSLEILTDSGRPMHVNEIVVALGQRYGRLTTRDSVSSALAKKARQGILIRQCAPATFEALDQQGEGQQ